MSPANSLTTKLRGLDGFHFEEGYSVQSIAISGIWSLFTKHAIKGISRFLSVYLRVNLAGTLIAADAQCSF